MPQCKALNKRGAQCRNAALPGSEYCDVAGHGPARVEVAAGPETTAPPPSPAPPPPLERPGDPEPIDAFAWLAELATDAGPASEPIAAPGDLPPIEGGGLDTDWLAAVEAEPVEAERPSRWTPENTGRLINPALNALFEATGKPPQKPAEEKYTAEVFAPIFDDLLSRVDPNSPWGALSLWCLAVPLPRYAGDLARAVMPGRSRSAGAPAPPPPDGREAPATRAFDWGEG